MKITKEIIKEIKNLRECGHSINEISKKLFISKTTVASYSKNISILPEYISLWKSKQITSIKRKEKKEKEAYKEASKLIRELSNKEKMLFLAALYWAEGSKKDFGLSNTDPNLIRTYISFLRDVYSIDKDQLKISIRIYEDLDKNKCLDFWSNIVGIPKERFINVNILSGKKKGKLAYGMCRVRVTKGGDFLKKIKAINNIVVESLHI